MTWAQLSSTNPFSDTLPQPSLHPSVLLILGISERDTGAAWVLHPLKDVGHDSITLWSPLPISNSTSLWEDKLIFQPKNYLVQVCNSQLGAVLPSKGHLAMSGDVVGCHKLEGSAASGISGRGQGCCLISYKAQDGIPHTHTELSSPK